MPAAELGRPPGQLPRAGFIAQVGGHEVGAAALGADGRGGLLAAQASRPGQHHVGAEPGEGAAAARPMPLLPPVTRAVDPVRSFVISVVPLGWIGCARLCADHWNQEPPAADAFRSTALPMSVISPASSRRPGRLA